MALTRAASCACVAVLLSSCHAALLDPRGPVGQANRTILIDSLAIMLAIVVPTMLATLGIAWWYRASNRRARYRPEWSFSGGIELVVWFIPVLTILLLGGVAWIGSHDLDPARPLPSQTPALEVQAVALDWKWLFIYPEQQVAAVNRLVVPVNVPLHFTLTSASVMNTFFVPRLGSMIYTMNGMATQLYLQADEAGTYNGLSGHFSGDGFADMHFDVQAVPADAFASWVAATRRDAATLDSARYAQLARQGTEPAPLVFAHVEDGLFDRVLDRRLAPGPGPGVADGVQVPASDASVRARKR